MAAAEAAAAPKSSLFTVPENSSNNQKIPSKSDPNALCKTLIILVLVFAIPLFPSQAPDFITQTVFNDFWEIIHLLFVGIAVAYGLFGRRTAEIAPDKIVDPRTDDSLSYLSGISQFTSIFDDGYENVCYEHATMPSYSNSGENDRFVVSSGKKIRSLAPNDGNESFSRSGNGVWCSQYSKGETLVVVSNGKCFLDGNSDFKPLNLPVRSLNSRANDKHESKNRNESSPRIEAKGDDNDDVKAVKIRGVMPTNLEKKFAEVSGLSKIPWRSRSWNMENGEEISNSKPPSHNRPHSVGEFEFARSKFSGSPEMESSNVERKRVFNDSHSKVAPVESEASSMLSSSSGSTDMDSVGDLENISKNSDVEEETRKAEQANESSDYGDAKSSPLAKAQPRAKSVRTVKPKRYTVNQSLNRGGGKCGGVFVKSQEDMLIIRREEKPQNEDCGRVFSMPKPKPTPYDEEERDLDDRNTTGSENIESGFEKNSDETRTNIDSDVEFGSEVDRKAGEFIAKFREQIRLQKTTTSSVAGNDYSS